MTHGEIFMLKLKVYFGTIFYWGNLTYEILNIFSFEKVYCQKTVLINTYRMPIIFHMKLEGLFS